MGRKGNSNELIKAIYVYQLPFKKLMRSIGFSYDFTGRRISELANQKLIEQTSVRHRQHNFNLLSLTKEGEVYLTSNSNVSQDMIKEQRARIKGIDNKYRQIKLAATLQMISSYVPWYVDDYIDFYANNLYYNQTNLPSRKYEQMRREIEQRKERSLNEENLKLPLTKPCENATGNWFISLRELRDIDGSRLKNIPSSRVHGILNLQNENYVIYNHMCARMEVYGKFEEMFKQTATQILDIEPEKSIHFALSYKVLLDTILKTPPSKRASYILSSQLYQHQYFVPLTHEGARQLEVYNIPGFKNKIKHGFILPDDISRADSSVYDGIDSNGNFLYCGFECDYNEIENIYINMSTIHLKKSLTIYCFPHQGIFFEELFKNCDVDIQIIPMETIIEYTKKE